MDKAYFRFKEHPGDLLRNSSLTELPNPKVNLEDFLIWFLGDYQSDTRVTYLDDLYKLLYNEFSTKADEKQFMEFCGKRSLPKLKAEIELTEHRLLNEAYQNFYFLISNNKIEIIGSNSLQ